MHDQWHTDERSDQVRATILNVIPDERLGEPRKPFCRRNKARFFVTTLVASTEKWRLRRMRGMSKLTIGHIKDRHLERETSPMDTTRQIRSLEGVSWMTILLPEEVA